MPPFLNAADLTGSGWGKLAAELQQPYMQKLVQVLQREDKKSQTVRPCPKNILKAFRLPPFKAVRVVIIGQDPYPKPPGMATGLCFSAGSRRQVVHTAWLAFSIGSAQISGCLP